MLSSCVHMQVGYVHLSATIGHCTKTAKCIITQTTPCDNPGTLFYDAIEDLGAQGTLPLQPILGSKSAKSDYSLLFVVLALRNELQYRYSDFKKFICGDLATLCVNLVNFGLVTPRRV